MKRGVLVAIGIVGLAVFLGSNALQGSLRRLLYMTTADPDVLGLVASTSMEPIELTLHTRRPELARTTGTTFTAEHETGKIIDERIAFVVPAAFVNVIDLKEGPAGPQAIGFAVWSGTFEPYMPDYLKGQQMSLPHPDAPSMRVENPQSPGAIRRRAGEYDLTFWISNHYRPSDEDRQRALSSRSLPDPEAPCERTILTELNLERIAVPKGVKPLESCLDWFAELDVNYRRYNPDGSIQFIAICRAGGKDRTGNLSPPPSCRVSGYFRNWPFELLVRNSNPEEFEGAFDRVESFLASIAKGDPPQGLEAANGP